MYRYEFTKGDTGKQLVLTLADENNGPVDITGATVLFRYTINGVAYDKTVPVTDGPNGIATAYWVSGDFTNWIPGAFNCQIKATLASGKLRYFPADGEYGTMTIRAAL